MSDAESPPAPSGGSAGTTPGDAAAAGTGAPPAARGSVSAREPTVPGGAGVVKAPAPAQNEGIAEQIVREFVDQTYNPQNPLGPFQDPHSTMIAGIEEHVGYIPGWLLLLMILAVLLAMIMWVPTSY